MFLQSGLELADTEHELESLKDTSFTHTHTRTQIHMFFHVFFFYDCMQKSLIGHPIDALAHKHTGLKGRGRKQCTAGTK